MLTRGGGTAHAPPIPPGAAVSWRGGWGWATKLGGGVCAAPVSAAAQPTGLYFSSQEPPAGNILVLESRKQSGQCPLLGL